MLRPGGPQLPYNVVTGVVPLRNGWMTASCKIAGITMSCEDPEFYQKFVDILDYKPSFDVVTVHAPIGYLDEATPGGRTCDREARAMLGARRGSAVRSARASGTAWRGHRRPRRRLAGLVAPLSRDRRRGHLVGNARSMRSNRNSPSSSE